jgi:LytS/YehU family sensor histidine kinase
MLQLLSCTCLHVQIACMIDVYITKADDIVNCLYSTLVCMYSHTIQMWSHLFINRAWSQVVSVPSAIAVSTAWSAEHFVQYVAVVRH